MLERAGCIASHDRHWEQKGACKEVEAVAVGWATGDNEGAIIKVVAAEFSGLLGNVAHVIIIWHDT